MTTPAFWVRKTLAQFSSAEWEALCDGCGKCCLHKLEDEDTGDVYYTRVACRLLDLNTCQCTNYAERAQRVPGCLHLTPEDVASFHWLPASCAYRLVAEGKPLPSWHHLVSGRRGAVHRAKQSVRGRVLPEESVDEDDLEDHIVRWV